MAERCYVYAIVPEHAHLPAEVTGLGGPLRVIRWRALGAVVGLAPSDDVVRPTPDHLLRHEQAVEAIRAGSPALPVRFGTVLANDDAVKRALTDRYDVLLDDLTRLGDAVEVGVTALWRPPSPPSAPDLRAPRLEEPASSALDTEPIPQRTGASYLRARLAEHQHASQQRARAAIIAADLDSALLPHALESRRALCPAPRLALRNAYLTDPAQVPAFQAAFDAVRREHQDVRLLLSGPWPPYSFVTPPNRDTRLAPLGHDHMGDQR
jgi:hypothetical protein